MREEKRRGDRDGSEERYISFEDVMGSSIRRKINGDRRMRCRNRYRTCQRKKEVEKVYELIKFEKEGRKKGADI